MKQYLHKPGVSSGMTKAQVAMMRNDKYNLSLVSNGLRRSETIHHYADAFTHLENVSQDIFSR